MNELSEAESKSISGSDNDCNDLSEDSIHDVDQISYLSDPQPDDSEDLEWDKATNNTKSEPLYASSKISVNEFCFSFVKLCIALKLSMVSRNLLLEFIRIILPLNSNLPPSYR